MWPVRLYPDYDGAVTYIHKVKDGKDIYFFANSRDAAVDCKVVLRGKKNVALWDPQTGERRQAEIAQSEQNGHAMTTAPGSRSIRCRRCFSWKTRAHHVGKSCCLRPESDGNVRRDRAI